MLCFNLYCYTHACYNYEGKKPKFCTKHKKNGMVDVKSSRCIHSGCKNQCSYNIPNEKARYCSTHRTAEMINVKNVIKKCIYPGCKIHPVFNIPNKSGGLYCNEHKLPNMINVLVKQCIHPDCKTRPHFNMPNQKGGLYCSIHKLTNMVNVIEKTCIYTDCKTHPSFNMKDKKSGLYCSLHRLPSMINVVSKTCKTSLCNSYVSKRYNKDYCLYCYVHLFPDIPVTRNYKTKEASVVEFVKTTFPHYSWITDKRVQDGCSKRRPDIFLDLGDQVLIVEVDENQHIDYDCSCENKRLMELSQDVDHRPIVFIRFNPDSYMDEGKKIPSCWELNNIGFCVIKNNESWEIRLDALRQQMEYWIQERTTKLIEVVQLFYESS